MSIEQDRTCLRLARDGARVIVNNLTAVANHRPGRVLHSKTAADLQSFNELEQDLRGLLQNTDELRNALFSPIMRLSDEVLRDIFLKCHGFLLNGKRSSVEPFNPVILTHVCRRWRIVALDTSYLWSELHLIGLRDPPFPRAYQQDVWRETYHAIRDTTLLRAGSRNQAFLTRSKHNPLSIRMKLDPASIPQTMDKISQLVSNGRQFREMRFHPLSPGSDWRLEPGILRLVQNTLKVLSIMGNWWRAPPDVEPLMSGEWPHLSQLTVSHVLIPKSRLFAPLSLPNLRRLQWFNTITPMAWEELQYLTISSGLLEELEVSVGKPFEPMPPSMPLITLPNLKYLQATGTTLGLGPVLEHLRCPKLMYLEVEADDSHEAADTETPLYPVIEAFLRGSSCKPRFISLGYLGEETWSTMSRCAPAVKALCCTGVRLRRDSVLPNQGVPQHRLVTDEKELVTLLDADPRCFPEVEELVFSFHLATSSYNHLLAVVRARSHNADPPLPVKPIRRVCLSGKEFGGAMNQGAEAIAIQKELSLLLDTLVVGSFRRDVRDNSWVEIEDGLAGWEYRWPAKIDRFW